MPRGDLALQPFVDWADQQARRAGSMLDAEIAMGVELGALSRTIYRCRHNEVKALTLGMVDRYLTAAGEPHQLAILYPPLDEPMADHMCPRCSEIVTVGVDGCCPWCDCPITPDARPVNARPVRTTSTTAWHRRAKEMRAAGCRLQDIADELGVSKTTAHTYVHAP